MVKLAWVDKQGSKLSTGPLRTVAKFRFTNASPVTVKLCAYTYRHCGIIKINSKSFFIIDSFCKYIKNFSRFLKADLFESIR